MGDKEHKPIKLVSEENLAQFSRLVIDYLDMEITRVFGKTDFSIKTKDSNSKQK